MIFLKLTLKFTLIFALVVALVFTGIHFYTNGELPFINSDNDTVESSYINTLLLGVDAAGVRTDTIIFAQYNIIDNSINMLQIPRDTYIDINPLDKKINSAYAYNKTEELFKEVEHLLGVEVNKYVLVDTSVFRDIINAIGGVEVDVKINMDYDDPGQDLHIHIKKGLQVLKDRDAEGFVRFRQNNDGSGYALGDVQRLEAQQEFINGAINQIFSIKNIFKAPKILSIIKNGLDTNFTSGEILKYGSMMLKMNKEDIKIMPLAGEGKYVGNVSYFVPYENENAEIIQQYFTPGTDVVNSNEIAIRDTILGDDDAIMVSSDVKVKESFFNRFIKVDILDASEGNADVAAIEEKLKSYGYKITNVNTSSGVVYSYTKVIGKKDNGNAEKIASIIGMDEYMINPNKGNGTNVTIILGKDINDIAN